MVSLKAWWREAAWKLAAASGLVMACLPLGTAQPGIAADAVDAKKQAELVQVGRSLFNHPWVANDPRAHGGDGLGPVFNAASCAACHEQGGIGGAGPREANVQVLSGTGLWKATELRHVHIGLSEHKHVVLHKSGLAPAYKRWHDGRLHLARSVNPQSPRGPEPQLSVAAQNFQDGMQRQVTALAATYGFQPHADDGPAIAVQSPRRKKTNSTVSFQARSSRGKPLEHRGVVASERSTTSLFGAGLIDSIDDAVIEQGARDQRVDTPQTAGSVARLADKRIGRFGWHAQMASLKDFTLTACAVELGLEVPGHPQAGNPLQPDYRPLGFDLTPAECDGLVAYVAQLPRPIEASHPTAVVVDRGRELFGKIGCADCHRPDLGGVIGLYSDLLLHDMGSELLGGKYGAFAPQDAPFGAQPKPATDIDKKPLVDFAADRKSDVLWRTPPLWGVASSAPYLHDGRASTLSAAIRQHGGQGQGSADRFAALPDEDRQALLLFLGTLVSPPTAEQPMRGQIGGGWGKGMGGGSF